MMYPVSFQSKISVFMGNSGNIKAAKQNFDEDEYFMTGELETCALGGQLDVVDRRGYGVPNPTADNRMKE